MAEDAKLYRERALAERKTAETSMLANVKDRALRSAERWEELAARAERAAEGAASRIKRDA